MLYILYLKSMPEIVYNKKLNYIYSYFLQEEQIFKSYSLEL